MEERYHGYLFHSRQPCIRHVVVIEAGQSHDLQTLDHWLADQFAIAADQLVEPAIAADDPVAGHCRELIRRALALHQDLLVAGRLPVFDSGRIISIEREPGHPGRFRAQIALPVIDNLPTSFFVDHFAQCLRLVLRLIATEPTAGAADALFAEIRENMLDKIKSAIPFWGDGLPIYKVAANENVPFRHLGNGVMRLGIGARSHLMREAMTAADSAIGGRLCANKWQTSRLLRDAGLPGAINILVRTADEALAAARRLGWPVVVKPSDHEQSLGVSVGIASEDALRAAFARAGELSRNVLVEKQAPGFCYRILVAGNRLIYAVARIPKAVVGNGRDTLAQLIAAAEQDRLKPPPWKRRPPFPDAADSEATLAGQGLTIQQIPAEGRTVYLQPFTSGDYGGQTENRTAEIHPENVKLALETARLLGVSLAGVDLITTDISRPWQETGAIVNEVNFNPQFATENREADARKLMSALVEGDGRIPVHLVTGEDDLLARGRALKARLSGLGRRCHLTTASHTCDPDDGELLPGVQGLFARSLALTMRDSVEEIIIAGSLADVFSRGLCVDRLDRVYVCESSRRQGRAMAAAIRARTPLNTITVVD